MGREIRRVPVDFQHPMQWSERYDRPLFGDHAPQTRWKNELAPMYGYTLAEAQADWETERAEALADGTLDQVWTQEDLDRWERDRPDQPEEAEKIRAGIGQPVWATVEDYVGRRPGERDDETRYTPEDWPPVEERGWVVFETVSEGTPITPCFATPDELIDWLATKGTAWDGPMSREAAERFVTNGWAPSMIVSGGNVQSALATYESGGALA